MSNKQRKINLWRDIPLYTTETSSNNLANIVFPSATQAIIASLKYFNLQRENRIALPDWSSYSVIQAVGKILTPVPLKEVLQYKISVSAILLYEQWGWPFSIDVNEIANKFKDNVIIFDCVDSADIVNSKRYELLEHSKNAIVYSLWKQLGLKGGGLVKIMGEYLSFEPTKLGKQLNDFFWINSQYDEDYENYLILLHKYNIEHLHPELNLWLQSNRLENALKKECELRRNNLKIVLESDVTSNWPKWMLNVYKKGASPGIIPLLKGMSEDKLKKYQSFFINNYNIITSIYHFNWSGNPLYPVYEQCLAVPVHGQITNIKKIFEDLRMQL